jgi:hypothetical protein
LVAVLVSQAAGCIITSDDEDAIITANWSLKQQSSGQLIPCPPGTTTAAVYSQPVDGANNPIGSPIIDLFDCDDNSGRTAPLPPDVYQVWVALTSEGGGSTYATSLSAIVDVINTDKTFSTTILNDGGYFQLTWDLVDSQTAAPMTCATADADGIGVVSTLVSNTSSFVDDKFTCEDHYGITGGLLQGAYTVAVDAFQDGPTGGAIGPTTTLTNKTIGPRNAVTNLGNVQIQID